jgi:3-oxoacyl-[acyl-carrier protein] reductase
MKINLTGKTALITGGAGDGLGRADALALGKAGAKIAILDIVDASETTALLKENGIEACSVICDITNENDVMEAVSKIKETLGAIQILINNASILDTVGFLGDISPAKWKRDVEVNLIGSANVTRAVWPDMLEAGWGRVLFMSSIAGTLGGAGQTSYSATKAGVIGLAKSLALEGGKQGITANAIAPGVVETKTAGEFIRPDMAERMKKQTATRSFAKPDDIANLITFLSSEQARHITGQVITIDGGASLFTF